MDRRIFTAGALAAAVSPAVAQRSDLRSVSVAIQGQLSARSIGRFVEILRSNFGKTIYLDVSGNEAEEPGGVFDIGEAQSGMLFIEHRSGRRQTTVQLENEFTKSGRNPLRYQTRGHFDCMIDRTDGDPNRIRLIRTPNMVLDRGATFPTVRL